MPKQINHTWMKRLGWIILVFAFYRMAIVAYHEPVAGYGNNYDMIRASACSGVWPINPHGKPTSANPEAPVSYYQKNEPQPSHCQWSPEVGLAYLGYHFGLLFSDQGKVDLRWIGSVKLAVLLVFLVLVQRCANKDANLGLLHSFAALSILADPINTLYFNTLYTEYSALLGFWLLSWG